MTEAHQIHKELSERNDKESILALIPKYKRDNYALAMIYGALILYASDKKEQEEYFDKYIGLMRAYMMG